MNHLKSEGVVWNASEMKANEFAGELLMPKVLTKPLIYNFKPSWDLIENLAFTCQVSLAAAISKFVKLTNFACWFVEIRNGRVNRFLSSDFAAKEPRIETGIKPNIKNTNKNWDECSPYDWFYDSSLHKKAKYIKILYSTVEINSKDLNVKYVILWDTKGGLDFDYD